MPFAQTEQSSVPQPGAQVHLPLPLLVPLPSQTPWPEHEVPSDDDPGHASQFSP